jgi:hypothetical protein
LFAASLAAFLGVRARSTIVPGHDDTHDDFKPRYKAEAAEDVEDTIKNDISTHKVFLYMKVGSQGVWHAVGCMQWAACSGMHRAAELASLPLQGVPEAPMCGFSNMACRILDAYGEYACWGCGLGLCRQGAHS